MEDVKIKIDLTAADHDSDNVRFMVGDEQVGFGYKTKSEGKICMIRCPKCGRENYAPAVATGTCAWCGFNPNEL